MGTVIWHVFKSSVQYGLAGFTAQWCGIGHIALIKKAYTCSCILTKKNDLDQSDSGYYQPEKWNTWGISIGYYSTMLSLLNFMYMGYSICTWLCVFVLMVGEGMGNGFIYYHMYFVTLTSNTDHRWPTLLWQLVLKSMQHMYLSSSQWHMFSGTLIVMYEVWSFFRNTSFVKCDWECHS